jgi:photosynthetic reaction center cytochrome c subunit
MGRRQPRWAAEPAAEAGASDIVVDAVSRQRSRARPWRGARWLAWTTLLGASLLLQGCERTTSVQSGYRGTGILQLYVPQQVAGILQENEVPEPEPVDEPDPESPTISEAFENVRVLNDLTVLEFSRLMQALSTWVAPVDGCEYCHNPDNLASDEKYPKLVARRMLQMTRNINSNWKSHVVDTGVTCWTCHRGNPVPSGIWFRNPGEGTAGQNILGNRNAQNTAGQAAVGNSSLPYDPLSTYLNTEAPEIRIQGLSVLRTGEGPSVKQAEFTYGLMIYMSNALGVNCTYCHNTRALAAWDQSTPQRAVAWHGIRMVRQLNVDYLNPIAELLPPNRLSAEGDGPKVACQTCHKGAYKPLFGRSMLGDYPELAGPMPGRPDPEVRLPPRPQAGSSPHGPTRAAAATLEAGMLLGAAAARR